jgi:GMP synthase-like glutamine amidotransferase
MKHLIRIQVLQHIDFEEPAAIQLWASARNYPISICHVYENQPLPKIDTFDLLVIMGGPMGVYDEIQYPWMLAEKELIKQAINNEKRIIGICLGAQILANVLGAKVYPNTEKEIGWWTVKCSPEAKNDQFGKLFSQEHTVFQWHGDTFNLPEGATLLMSSDACTNQAFTYKKHVLALQFHLEVLPESIETFTRMCANELVDEGKYIQTARAMCQPNSAMQPNQQLLYNLIDELIKQS